MDLRSSNPVDFGPILAGLPGEVRVDDPRIDALVQAISTASIAPTEKPLSSSTLPNKEEFGRTISIKPPEDLRDGADYSEYSIPIPVDAFVAAPEVTDWRNARGDELKGEKKSSDVVRKYANLPGRTAPPIQHVRVYIRPDGGVFAELTGDGAHRLCAARRRCDTHILSRDVKVIVLDSASTPVV